MKYVVTHSCGHTETVELFGKAPDRERRVAWLEGQPCAKCRAKEGAPDLTGSPRQRAWAADIRSEAVRQLEDETARYAERGRAAGVEGVDMLADRIRRLIADAVASHTDSRWWIDNRAGAAGIIESEAAKAMGACK